ncbi:hypothetical protein DCAR_0727525 [Daucus carota subsp. sativus]|uniref:Ubiquitin-like domain-containing protein n=1 Tax=Daucus carota subsp. sativus TaxID=79200 RepID=A0AAF0XHD7_DAUCS|nr:PREDICTED: BAG family molecular chaperone regulator 4-like [Daucus carota subsp. sativus]WOH08088.1 hypothetical protein DCAR_0727525 [Daucus carota subsp. sativus]
MDYTGDDGGSNSNFIKIKVSYGSNWLDLTVPSHITFGDLKGVIAEKIGLEPDVQRLFFRGIEKDDQIHLEMAGLKNNSKLLLKENIAKVEEVSTSNDKTEEVKETQVSKGSELVAEVKADVDKLAEQLRALKKIICEGHKVLQKDLIFTVEMLERQLLKLDGIKAEGEGKVQRKMEVQRVQSLLDTADELKTRNLGSKAKSSDTVQKTTNCDASESDIGNHDAQPSSPSSTKGTQDWEVFE